jgi:hypothetical protein
MSLDLNDVFEGVCTVQAENCLYVVTPFAHEDKDGAVRACTAFQQAKEAGAKVALRYWQFEYEGRAPTQEDFAPDWSTPQC